jgi:hypothetical protein
MLFDTVAPFGGSNTLVVGGGIASLKMIPPDDWFVPDAKHWVVVGQAMLKRSSTLSSPLLLTGTVSVVQVVPPSDVPRMAPFWSGNPAHTVSQVVFEEHEIPNGVPTVPEGIVSYAHVAPPLLVATTECAVTASQVETEGQEIPLRTYTPLRLRPFQVVPPFVVVRTSTNPLPPLPPALTA